jgi:putative ubiquitin-RnfH superfamily antitoxin RatB of RatAB toxin-antitoxin module
VTSDRKGRTLRVEIVYALRKRQALIALEVEDGTTAGQAIENSGILRQFPQIDPATSKVGVFGRVVPLDTPLRNGDRVEIYRPLEVDPKEARRARAKRSSK